MNEEFSKIQGSCDTINSYARSQTSYLEKQQATAAIEELLERNDIFSRIVTVGMD